MKDVIISGAGPVGLFLACELALANCSVTILEKSENPHTSLKQIPFGIRGLSAPTIEALYRRDLLKDLEVHKRMKNPHQNSGTVNRRQVGHFAGIPFYDDDIDTTQWKYRLDSSTETNLMSEMDEIETIFTSRAETLGVEIKRGYTITGFHQTNDQVTIDTNNGSFECKWLVGCDGARSVVRRLGGFEFAGTEPEFTGYSTNVDIEDPEKLKSGRNVTERGMYLQSQPGYVIIQDFDGGEFHSSEKPITKEHIQEVLRRISNTDVTINALHAATTWTDRARQATSYRNNRIFLAGDAAHIHSPLGGQGLNLGIGDAMNLGWKLAATIKGTAPDSLLDSYQTERYPVGAQVLDWSRAQVAIMKPTPEGRALNALFRDIVNTRDGATYIAGRVWGIHTRYDLGGDHPLVGCSVPNFEFENGTSIGEQMRDGKTILLDFNGDTALREIVYNYGNQLRYISGTANEQLGINALLIRPDGIIAWAADKVLDFNELQKTIAIFVTPEKGG